MRTVVFLLAGLLAACQADLRTESTVPKAVFIIVDGVPADVIENAATPNLDAIAADTGYTRSYVGGEPGQSSASPTVSAVGYNHLLTGTWSYKHNVWDNDIGNPDYGYWDIFRIAKAHDASLKTAIFSTWTDNRTKLLGDGLPEAGGHKLDYAFDGFELDTARFPHDDSEGHIRDIDWLVSNEAARYIDSEGPDLSWVYLEYTDAIGHLHGDGEELTEALREKDAQVGKIWAAVQARERAHNEDWLVVVTTDHGRDAVTGRDHGYLSDRERTTWIFTNSRRLNSRFANNPPIVDIAPSIATHLRLDVPKAVQEKWDGQSFID
ncbi:MAG: alkaline phosphatase family protein [Gammaproteobacteria bacterium]|nr:alkaline phosphatase family protein [Gammaproteobacteria bacterium]